MNNQEITSSPPNYSWLLLGLTALTCACLLSCCQTKKKSLDIQKSEQSQSSDVKKETADSTSDKSHGYYIYREAKSGDYSEVVEESADSARIDKEGRTTLYNPKRKETRIGKRNSEKKSETSQQNDVKSSSSLKLDSVGKSHVKDKSRIQAKEVKESKSLKTFAFAALLIAIAITWILYQIRKAKKSVIG